VKPMDEKLVTIAEFDDYIMADMARQTLEDFGIKAVVTGDNASNAYGSIFAVERPALQVLESQADEARQILEEQSEKTENGEQMPEDGSEDFEIPD
jgi:hypothetical protein